MSKNNSMEVESTGIHLVTQGTASCEPVSSFSIMLQVVTKYMIIENDKVDKILKREKVYI